jgi:hypothetical protein
MSCIDCNTPACDCPVKDLGTDCSVYNQDTNLSHIASPKGTILSTVLQNINTAFGDLKDSMSAYFLLENVGLGRRIYKGISGLGAKQLRTFIQGTNVELVEGDNDITVNVPDSSESVSGVAEIATQGEVDAGIDTVKIVTPATLSSFVLAAAPDGSETIVNPGANVTITGTGTTGDPYVVNTAAGVPDGSETIVTEGTAITITGTGTSGDPYVINATVAAPDGSETIVNPGANVTVTGAGTIAEPYVINATAVAVADASENVKGLVEEATQVEVDAGTDVGATGARLFITPSKLATHLVNTLPASYMQVVTVPDITSWGYNSINYLTHNIGVAPMNAVIHAICTSAEGGYSPGDIILITNHGESYEDGGSGSQAGVTFVLNTSGISSTLLISKRIVAVQKAVTSSTFQLDVTKWDLRVKFIYVN